MAWFRSKDTDPQADGDLLLDKLSAAIEAKLEAKLSPINAQVGELTTKWTAIENAAKPPERTPAAEPPARVSVLDDEDAAFAQRLGPILYQTVMTNARMTERDIYDEMKQGGWEELIPEVRRHLEGTDAQRKSKGDYPAYCHNVMDMVIGAKARSSGLRMNQADKSFYLESGNTNGSDKETRISSELNWADSKGRVHTGDEVASKLGLSNDDVKAIVGSEFIA